MATFGCLNPQEKLVRIHLRSAPVVLSVSTRFRGSFLIVLFALQLGGHPDPSPSLASVSRDHGIKESGNPMKTPGGSFQN